MVEISALKILAVHLIRILSSMFNIIIKLFNSNKIVFFSIIAAIIVLWQLLMPGYVLTLDMVFGPRMGFPLFANGDFSSLPYQLILYVLQLFLSGWIVEKVVLVLLFFLLFYLPLKFYPFGGNYGERYFVSLLYAVNPWVYERFLAGQWTILYAYAFLVPFISLLIDFYKTLQRRSVLYAGVWFLGIGVFSLHLLVIASVVWMVFVIAFLIQYAYIRQYATLKIAILRTLAAMFSTAGICLYWIIPMVFVKANVTEGFGVSHWDAFKTAGDPFAGTIGNVVSLYGFWGENELWWYQFVSPKDHFWQWVLSGIVLGVILLAGLIEGFRRGSLRFVTLINLLIFLISIIFSSGAGDTVFRGFNMWFFEHIPFWNGFRDSQKWSSLIVASYCFFGGIGAGLILEKFKKYKFVRRIVLILLCTLPLLYTPAIIFGFNGQLKTVQYPEAWSQVNRELMKDKDCKAVFLPWHLYYSLSFNDNLLTANTASKFFDCDILSGRNAEIGMVGYPPNLSHEYIEVMKVVTDNKGRADDAIRIFAKNGIHFIIYTSDIKGEDNYRYPFLSSRLIRKIYEKKGIAIYRNLL